MTFLPIVVRELRLGARHPATYRARVLTALVAIVAGSYGLILFQFGGRAAGSGAFSLITDIAFLYCLIIGLRNSVDSISQEKREGTLGLLFLTDLKGHDIALGKLVSIGMGSFYGLLAAFPILGISLMLGGITGTRFVGVMLALLNVLFFAHAAGLMVSAFSVHARKAMSGGAMLVLFFVVGFPMIGGALSSSHSWVLRLAELLSPVTPMSSAQGIGGFSVRYWSSLLSSHLLAWGFLAIASWHLPRCWQDKGGSFWALWQERFAQWTFGRGEARQRVRRRLLAQNPFLWLISRNRWTLPLIWTSLVLAAIAPVIALSVGGAPRKFPLACAFSLGLVHFAIKLWIISESARHLGRQRRDGGLEFLLSCTPLDVPDVLRGHWLALRRLFFRPVMLILIVDASVIVVLACMEGVDRELPWCIAAAMIMLVADWFALGWLGMWLGLSENRPNRAASGTLFRILILPWSLFAFPSVVFRVGPVSALGLRPFSTLLVIWLAISLAIDTYYIIVARKDLYSRFRQLATPLHSDQLTWWGRLGRALGRAYAKSASS